MNEYIENDKIFLPFLFACSYNGLIKFERSHTEGRVLFYHFSPKAKALELINQFQAKAEPHIPAKDIFEALEVFWRQVSETRNGAIKNGENQPK